MASAATLPGDPPAAKGAKGAKDRRFYRINIGDLIVHKYDEHEIIMRKAMQVARDIIDGDLRDGEYMRSPGKGVIELYLPALRPEAAELRTSVIAEQIAREIRAINPAANQLEENADALVSRRQANTVAKARVPTAKPARTAAGGSRFIAQIPGNPDEEEMRRQASQALGLMASGTRLRLEELLGHARLREAHSTPLTFTPIWQTKRDVLSAYECTFGDEGIRSWTDSVAGPTSAQADACVLLRINRVLQTLLEDGLAALLVAPVHFTTLSSSSLMSAYLEALSEIPAAHRQYLVFELREVPPDASRFRLTETISHLRGRCRKVMARVQLDSRDVTRFKEAGFFGVGVDLPAGMNDQRLIRLFDNFAAGAERAGLHCGVFGLSRRPLVLAAIGAGFDYISGPAVSTRLESPAGIQRMNIDNLYGRLSRN